LARLEELGIEVSDDVRKPARRSPYGWTAPELRPYQEAALAAWHRAGQRGTIVLPTGSGKTRLAIAALARDGRRALCLVPTLVLVEQWCKEIARHHDGEVGWYGGGIRRLAPVTVSTFASAERHMERLGSYFDLLVVDEAHNVLGGPVSDALEMSIASARLGLTATPPRDPQSLARLTARVGPVVFELAIGDLAGSFLAHFDLVTLVLDLSAPERTQYEQEMRVFREAMARFRATAPDGAWVDFVRSASRSADGRRALACFRQAKKLLSYTAAKREVLAELLGRHADARVLVFTSDNETAYQVARERLIMPITCDIVRREREAALEKFRTGALRALVSARVLNEGVDLPDADVAIVVGGSLGEREHVQRIGRLLRPVPGKRAIVYELVARATMEVTHAKKRRAGLAASVTAQL
jgi:superfamily II DNA or RNA helicase